MNSVDLLLVDKFPCPPLLLVDLHLFLLCAVALIVLSDLKNASTVPQVLFEAAFVVVVASPSTTGRAALPIRNESALAVPHVIAPVTNVPLLVLVEVISLAVPLIILPVSDVKFFVVVEALPFLSIPRILLPTTVVLVARLPLPISASVHTLPVSLLGAIDVALVGVSIRVLDPDYVSSLVGFLRRLPSTGRACVELANCTLVETLVVSNGSDLFVIASVNICLVKIRCEVWVHQRVC